MFANMVFQIVEVWLCFHMVVIIARVIFHKNFATDLLKAIVVNMFCDYCDYMDIGL